MAEHGISCRTKLNCHLSRAHRRPEPKKRCITFRRPVAPISRAQLQPGAAGADAPHAPRRTPALSVRCRQPLDLGHAGAPFNREPISYDSHESNKPKILPCTASRLTDRLPLSATTGRSNARTPERPDNRTPGRQDNRTPERQDNRTPARRNAGTTGHRDNRTTGRQHTSTQECRDDRNFPSSWCPGVTGGMKRK